MMNRCCPRPSTLAGPRAIVQAGRWSSPPPPAHHLNRVFPGPEPPNHAQQPTVYRCTQVGLPTRDPRATTPLTADHLHGHGGVPQMVQLVIGVSRAPAPCTPNHFWGSDSSAGWCLAGLRHPRTAEKCLSCHAVQLRLLRPSRHQAGWRDIRISTCTLSPSDPSVCESLTRPFTRGLAARGSLPHGWPQHDFFFYIRPQPSLILPHIIRWIAESTGFGASSHLQPRRPTTSDSIRRDMTDIVHSFPTDSAKR